MAAPTPNTTPEPERRDAPTRINSITIGIAALLIVNAAALAWLITQQAQHTTPRSPWSAQLVQTAEPAAAPSGNHTLAVLTTLPATSHDPNLPSVHAFVDFECPYCQQFFELPAFQYALELADVARINLSVAPVAFVTPNSPLKANLFSCSAPHRHPSDLGELIAALKVPGVVPAPDLPLRWVSEAQRDDCMLRSAELTKAMEMVQRLGVNSVPTVFVDGVAVPWPEFGQHLAAALEVQR